MRSCRPDKIASVCLRAGLGLRFWLGTEIPAEAGTLLAGRILNAKTRYRHLEDLHGRLVALHPGDVVAGALGHRDALHGFSGRVPERVRVGDRLQLLNQGGVIGTGARSTPGVGEPFELEVLGCILEFPFFDRRVGVPARLARHALKETPLPASLPPVLVVAGTSMDAGKTTAAAALIGAWNRQGLRVAAGKLTGVSLRRDALQMEDSGAAPAALFTDFGVVTTDPGNAVRTARALLGHLAAAGPDLVVLEMGDGLLGRYGVHEILDDGVFRAAMTGLLLCAQDPVGAWGGVELLERRYSLRPAALSGRVTDSAAGLRFSREELDLPAWNAMREGERLARELLPALLPAEATA